MQDLDYVEISNAGIAAFWAFVGWLLVIVLLAALVELAVRATLWHGRPVGTVIMMTVFTAVIIALLGSTPAALALVAVAWLVVYLTVRVNRREAAK